jgi:hypothetical protein
VDDEVVGGWVKASRRNTRRSRRRRGISVGKEIGWKRNGK